MIEDKSINQPQPAIPKLSKTQAKVVKKKIEADLSGKSITEVAPEVFPNQTPEAARVSMSRTLQNATVQEAIAAAMEQAGLTANTLVAVVADGMKATKTVIIRDNAASGEEAGNSAFADEVPDHGIRLKAAGMAAQWLGVGKGGEGGNNLTMNFISISGGDRGEFNI